MKSFYMASLLLLAVSTLLPSMLAIDDYLPPNHAVPEMLVTIMTPRDKKLQFERQLFDFGSPQSGFSELKHIAERQTTCSTGYGTCPNDPGTCCPLGGRCCGGGLCCGSGRWCYGGGCCLLAQDGCDNQGCCDTGAQCCQGGTCCPNGNNCVIINGQLGCCPIGQICTPTCTTTGYSLCPDGTFCCPTGFTCYRDSLNNPQCQNPDSASPSTTSTPPSPTYTTLVSVTSTSTRNTKTGTALSTRTTSVGAAVGGAAAGAVAVIILVVILFIWRHRRSQQPGAPTTAPITVPPDQPYGSAGAMPLTPGTGNPSLTPMTQNRNLGVSRLNDGTPGANSVSQYSGMPRPHYSDNAGGIAMGAAAGAGAPMATPAPRHDLHSPRPLPMSVVYSKGNYASGNNTSDSGSPHPWSGHASGLLSSSANLGAYIPQSEPSGWSHPTSNVDVRDTPYAEGATSSGYAPDRQGQLETASTTRQPSSHGSYDESLMARSPPPISPLPVHLAVGRAAGKGVVAR